MQEYNRERERSSEWERQKLVSEWDEGDGRERGVKEASGRKLGWRDIHPFFFCITQWRKSWWKESEIMQMKWLKEREREVLQYSYFSSSSLSFPSFSPLRSLCPWTHNKIVEKERFDRRKDENGWRERERNGERMKRGKKIFCIQRREKV